MHSSILSFIVHLNNIALWTCCKVNSGMDGWNQTRLQVLMFGTPVWSARREKKIPGSVIMARSYPGQVSSSHFWFNPYRTGWLNMSLWLHLSSLRNCGTALVSTYSKLMMKSIITQSSTKLFLLIEFMVILIVLLSLSCRWTCRPKRQLWRRSECGWCPRQAHQPRHTNRIIKPSLTLSPSVNLCPATANQTSIVTGFWILS